MQFRTSQAVCHYYYSRTITESGLSGRSAQGDSVGTGPVWRSALAVRSAALLPAPTHISPTSSEDRDNEVPVGRARAHTHRHASRGLKLFQMTKGQARYCTVLETLFENEHSIPVSASSAPNGQRQLLSPGNVDAQPLRPRPGGTHRKQEVHNT